MACRSANGGWSLWPHNILCVFGRHRVCSCLPHDEANLKFCDLPATQGSHIHIIILAPAIVLLPSFLQRNISCVLITFNSQTPTHNTIMPRSRTPSPATTTSSTFRLSPAPNEDHLPTLSRPILVQERSSSKNRNRSTSRSRKYQNDGVGGDLVGNMKRGVRIDDGSRKASRLGVLC